MTGVTLPGVACPVNEPAVLNASGSHGPFAPMVIGLGLTESDMQQSATFVGSPRRPC